MDNKDIFLLFAVISIWCLAGYIYIEKPFEDIHLNFKKHIKQHKMINTKILLKAMSFMFLPTLCILFIIFCWFFSWTDFSAFITSQSTGASIMRIIMMILEVFLCYTMYCHYMAEYEVQQKKEKVKKFILDPDAESESYKEVGYSNYIRDIFKTAEGRDFYKYYAVDGPTDDLIFVKRAKVQ